MIEWEFGNAGDGDNAAAANSQPWHISDVRVQASVINLNCQLQEAHAANVSAGKSFMIPFKACTCTSSVLPDSNDHDSSIALNLTRLCTLLQTFNNDDTHG